MLEEYFGVKESISYLLDLPAAREGDLKRFLAYAQAAQSQAGPGPLSKTECDALLREINLHLAGGSHGAQLTNEQTAKLLSLLTDPNQNIWDPHIDPKDASKIETLGAGMGHDGVLDLQTAYENYIPNTIEESVGGEVAIYL
jgi:hypothetical protein